MGKQTNYSKSKFSPLKLLNIKKHLLLKKRGIMEKNDLLKPVIYRQAAKQIACLGSKLLYIKKNAEQINAEL